MRALQLIENQNKSRTCSRRGMLRLSAAAGACALLPAPALANVPRQGERRLAFYNLHTGERTAATYWADGSYLTDGLSEINHLLRDFRTGEVRAIDRRLLDLLYALQDTLDTRDPFHVISGYRSPKTNASLASTGRGVAKQSLHMRGMAVDIRLPGQRLGDLRDAAKALRGGGVGYYAGSNFVHVDIGRVRYW